MIAQSKSIHNLTGSYSRWDLFSLATRQDPYPPISPLEAREATDERPGEAGRVEQRIAALEKQIDALRSELKRSG